MGIKGNMKNYTLPRLDEGIETRQKLLPLCRLKPGEIWIDPVRRHKVGCVDAADPTHIQDLMGEESTSGNSRSSLQPCCFRDSLN